MEGSRWWDTRRRRCHQLPSATPRREAQVRWPEAAGGKPLRPLLNSLYKTTYLACNSSRRILTLMDTTSRKKTLQTSGASPRTCSSCRQVVLLTIRAFRRSHSLYPAPSPSRLGSSGATIQRFMTCHSPNMNSTSRRQRRGLKLTATFNRRMRTTRQSTRRSTYPWPKMTLYQLATYRTWRGRSRSYSVHAGQVLLKRTIQNPMRRF